MFTSNPPGVTVGEYQSKESHRGARATFLRDSARRPALKDIRRLQWSFGCVSR
jgi:hypothetical protein